ncbi:MAG TPA: recombinase family protein [Symbiobacteriaceae bacterium]|jgi:DNA invertase Pin-like site-specific DNA recombinase
MLAAAIYRVSTEKQVKRDGEDSIPVQATAVRAFVAAHPGWTLVREYAEEGVSGFKVSAADRDVLQQALADARRGLFQALIVFKADRLSRNSMEYPLVIDRFRRLGCEVWSVADAPGGRLLALDTQMDKFIRFLEGWQAESESQNTSIRVSAAMRQMAAEGRWTGGPPPFGFRLNPARRPRSSQPALLIDESQAAAVRRMVRLYLEERMGCSRIAAVLNQEGVGHLSGRPWDGQRVRRILQNPIIAGLPTYGRTRPGLRTRAAASPYDLVQFVLPRDAAGNPRPVPDLQIVPLDLWLQVLAAMQSKRRAPAGAASGDGSEERRLRPARGLLTGLLVCGHCGARLVAGTGARDRRYYLCRTHVQVGRSGCDGQRTYGARRLEQAVLAQLARLLARADPAGLQGSVRQEQAAGAAEARRQQRVLAAELARAERVLAGWLDRLEAQMAGPVEDLGPAGHPWPEPVLLARIRAAEQRREQLKQAAEAPAPTEVPPQTPGGGWWEAFAGAPQPVQRLLLHDLLQRVVVWRDRLELDFRVDLATLLG